MPGGQFLAGSWIELLKAEKIKIVYLINGLGSGGAEMMLFRLLQKLDRSRFDPVVVSLLEQEGPIRANILNLGICVHVIGMQSKLDFLAVYRLYRLLKRLSPVILQTQLFAADIIGRVIGRLLKIPVTVSSIRNIYYGGYNRDLLIKWTDPLAAKTTVVSSSAAQRLIQKEVIPPSKLIVIHNGLDPGRFTAGLGREEKDNLRSALGLPGAGFLWLAVGSLTPQKGYPDLLRACEILKAKVSKFYLIVAGEGVMNKELQRLSARRGLTEQVFFLGRSDDIPRLMAAADALVLSSLWEGLPGVVMEAMASGLPVVATAVGGTPELVIDGQTGFLVPPGEPEVLASALEKVTALPVETLAAMGLAGRRRVEERFHVDRMVEKYERLYLQCLEVKRTD